MRGLVVDAQHDAHGGAVDVRVQEAHAGPGLRQGRGEVGGHGGLAHAALARGHGDGDFHLRQEVLDEGAREAAITWASMMTSMFFTPGKAAASTSSAWALKRSLTGQAGVVRTMRSEMDSTRLP